jgi:uncharacterized membrane protein
MNMMHHRRVQNPNEVHNERLSPVEHFCKRVSDSTGAPIALAAVIVVQIVWLVVGEVTRTDPYPFVFLLTVSNVIQLTLLFVISVAQRQSSQHAEARAELDHEWISLILHHNEAQEELLLRIAAKVGAETNDLRTQVEALK